MRTSVVIPAFDVEPWVASAIESVLGQDPPPDEVILVDDGSADRTAEIAGSYAGVRVLQQQHRGAAAARNAGATVAGGEILLFLDADDTLMTGALSALHAAAAEVPGAAAVIPNHLPAGGGSPAWSPGGDRVLSRRRFRRLIVAERLAGNALVRREIWDRHRFREGLQASEDLDFWMRLVLAGERLVVLGRPLVRWRAGRPGALTGRRVLMRQSRRLLFEAMVEREDLSATERVLLGYQLARASAGEAAARRAAGEPASGARSGLRRSRSALVRGIGRAFAVPGLLPAATLLDSGRRR